MILIPVKNLANAKQRLSPVLDAEQRVALARAMVADVFSAVGAWRGRPAVAVVTGDPFAIRLACEYGFEIIADSENPGETGAVAIATRICESRGVTETLVIPADIPLVTAIELETIYRAAPAEGSVLVPSADGRGSNAVLRRPASLFPLKFGDDSFQPHLAAARATGKPVTVLRLPGVALDIDRPPDLTDLLGADGATRTQHLLREWRIAAPLTSARTA